MKPHQKLIDEAELPGQPLRAAMAELVTERLGAAGYVKVGLDHYARPDDTLALAATAGSLRRNFQGYVADGEPWVGGIGASAISSLPRGFSQNVADPARYMDKISVEGLATARGIACTADDRLRADIIEQLMCNYRVDLADRCRRHHIDPEAFLAGIDRLSALERNGLVSRDGLMLAVTDAARPLVRFVCAAFDRHYTGAAGKHASGV